MILTSTRLRRFPTFYACGSSGTPYLRIQDDIVRLQFLAHELIDFVPRYILSPSQCDKMPGGDWGIPAQSH
jgi:hypothetical protein